nr:DNA polymerase IV [Faunimonas pinastri]
MAGTALLCRSCLRRSEGATYRCPACGSPRIVRHEELFSLTIAHIDCDAFYASVEKRDDPSLHDKPLIIGGGRRGVVSTACYNARTFGVHSAMPMFKALQACPQAVVIRPDMAKYVAVSREVRRLMLELTPAVEPLSIDEAFLDLTGTERLHKASAAEVLARLQKRIEAEIGITVSVGLSHNKFLAKIASDLDKPRGFAVIGRAETKTFLAEKPVSLIWGVGAASQKRLASDGITRIGQLQVMDESLLAKRYGAMGLRLARLSRGEDVRSITPDREAKSISAETTFEDDRIEAGELLPVLRGLAEKVSGRLKQQELAGRTVTLKLKSSDFRLRTRSAQLGEPTQLADRIFRLGRDLLMPEIADPRERFRLIGIGVSHLTSADNADPVDLLDPGAEQRARIEAAMDRVRGRFGTDGIRLGLTLPARKTDRPRGG